ncbi:carbohydrate esterase [Acidaminobacter sp. JC074]|uniref:PIG-L family deacetylase n=1 Tax=Acidaminobacter sp. JC074 TaxID=2530199 RepID=UPI001F0D0A83|nr:PIG-L family deacetylase [Acidaminobacter sp. JC074]MCH4888977.1 carbohydrate esterase [Acidaminobacter sp. JC074]
MLDYLFIGAHPDDESSVVGMMLKAKNEGKKTGVVILTKGEAGGFATKNTRVEELKKAAEMMDLDVCINLDFPDAGVEFNMTTVDAIIKVLVEHKPKVVLTLHSEDYHPDHRAVSQSVDRAVFVAGLKKHMGNETWHPQQVLYVSLDQRTNPHRPDLIIDITEVYSLKEKVVSSYESQGILPFVEKHASYYGGLGGFKYGEGLYIKQPLRISTVSSLLNKSKIGR